MATMAELFATGYQLGRDIQNQDKALRAAQEKYGDIALDPGLFSALAGEQRAQESHTQGMRLRETAEARAQGGYDLEVEAAEQAKAQKALLGLVNGLRTARDRGEDVGVAFDNYAKSGLLETLGVDPNDIPAMRQAVVDNPAILDDYYTSLTGPQAGGARPTDREQARRIMNDPSASPADQQWAAKVMGVTPPGGGNPAAAAQVSGTVEELRDIYNALDEGAGITAAGHDPVSSAVRWVRSSAAGRMAGSVLGTRNESLRQQAEGARQLLILAIKNATGMSARQMDSNVELQAMLRAATDPALTYEANMAALDRLDALYGLSSQGAGGDYVRQNDVGSDGAPVPTDLYPGAEVTIDGQRLRYIGQPGSDPSDPVNWEPL